DDPDFPEPEEPGPAPVCTISMSDEFDGDGLQTQRWSTVRSSDGGPITVADGALNLPVTGADIDGSNTGPISYVGQPVPSGEWQQPGLLVHSSDDDYVKLAYTQGQDGERFVEFWSESDGERDQNAPNINVDGDAPATIHLRLSSDGENLTAAYSFDGETFTT